MTTKATKSCTSYKPSKHDPVICAGCAWSWGAHSPDVRSVFCKISAQGVVTAIEHRYSYTSQAKPEYCNELRPIKYGEDLAICECGRFDREHNLRVQIRYKEKLKSGFKEKVVESYLGDTSKQCRKSLNTAPGVYTMCMLGAGHPGLHEGHGGTPVWDDVGKVNALEPSAVRIRQAQKPCGLFAPQTSKPGWCRYCNHKYIDHPEDCRGYELEELTHLHAPSCKSIVGLGEQACTCLTDTSKQMLLDTLTQEHKAKCAKYTPQDGMAQYVQVCKTCHYPFYKHALPARENFGTWTEWRAAHMTDQEVFRWFINLGSDDKERMQAFMRHLDKPEHMNAYAPSPRLIKLMWEFLPEKLQNLGRPPIVDGVALTPSQVSNIIDPDSRRDCYSCGGPLELNETYVCADCTPNLNDEGRLALVTTPSLGTKQMMSMRGPAKPEPATEPRETAPETDAEDHDD